MPVKKVESYEINLCDICVNLAVNHDPQYLGLTEEEYDYWVTVFDDLAATLFTYISPKQYATVTDTSDTTNFDYCDVCDHAYVLDPIKNSRAYKGNVTTALFELLQA